MTKMTDRGVDGQRRAIAKMSGFITMHIGADKLNFKSFERRSASLSEIECNEKDGRGQQKQIDKEHGANSW